MSDPTSDPLASLDGIRLPLTNGPIEAARTMYRDKKGAECTVCFSIGLQVGDYVEPMNNLVRVLVERGVPTAAISDGSASAGARCGEAWRLTRSRSSDAWNVVSPCRCAICAT